MGERRQRPSNAPGAHYLADSRLAAQLVAAADLGPGDLVLDLGAGAGALTAPLVRAGARVVAIERDPRLARRLRQRFETTAVTVLEADALETPLPRRPYRVVASIPFAITTPLLRRLLDPPATALQRAVVVVEWGAAKRFSAARPADARILWWAARFGLRIARRVKAQSFNPPPRVDAAVLIVDRRPSPLIAPGRKAAFLALSSEALRYPRAPARRALARTFSSRQLRRLLGDLSVSHDASIGELTIEHWAAIDAAVVELVDRDRRPRRSRRGRRR